MALSLGVNTNKEAIKMATEKEQKAKAKQDKADFNLHVSLLMRMGKKLP